MQSFAYQPYTLKWKDVANVPASVAAAKYDNDTCTLRIVCTLCHNDLRTRSGMICCSHSKCVNSHPRLYFYGACPPGTDQQGVHPLNPVCNCGVACRRRPAIIGDYLEECATKRCNFGDPRRRSSGLSIPEDFPTLSNEQSSISVLPNATAATALGQTVSRGSSSATLGRHGRVDSNASTDVQPAAPTTAAGTGTRRWSWESEPTRLEFADFNF